MGYLPAGLRNYLARLGWSHGDDEIFSTEQMIEWFDIDDINKAPGRLDFAKLADVNAPLHPPERATTELLAPHQGLAARCSKAGPRSPAAFEAVGWDKLAAALPTLKERAKTLQGPGRRRRPTCSASRPLALDDKAAKLLDAEARANLAKLLPLLEARRRLEGSGARGRRARFRRARAARSSARSPSPSAPP